MARYKILMHDTSYQKTAAYFEAYQAGSRLPGAYLRELLASADPGRVDLASFLELLVNSKRLQLFAESAVFGDGRDWNQEELSILGDIAISVPVTVYDDGLHNHPHVHPQPFRGMLLYVPGALLRSGKGTPPADWDEVTSNGDIDAAAYYRLYERRLLPSLLYANEAAGSMHKQALITIPGIGCGQFAGPFHGRLGAELKTVLVELLHRFQHRLPNIRVVYYDPYSECANERLEIEHISLLVRPLTQGNGHKPQLCRPQVYEEEEDDFTGCHLFSFVAWDHVSWPGNDFWGGSRTTDDGVKAAATDSMAVMTGITGGYDARTNTYKQPAEYRNWDGVVSKNSLSIEVQDNLLVFV